MLAVLGVAAVISLGLAVLWNNARTEEQIAANKYRVSQARSAAHSGMSHFISLHLSDEQIDDGIAIPETELTPKTSYVVEAVWVEDGKLIVLSKGKYKKAGKTVFEYPMRAVFAPVNVVERTENNEQD